MSSETFALIGPGRVGLAISRRLSEADYLLTAVIGRSDSSGEAARTFLGKGIVTSTDLSTAKGAEVLLLAVPDDQITAIAKELHRRGITNERSLLIHFSGLHTASILLETAPTGCMALSLHPLMTFPSPQAGYDALPGAPMSVEGDNGTLPQGETLAKSIGCTPFRLPSDKKPLYHAAAVVSCNYAIGLAAAGRDLMAQCGVGKEQAWQMLLPLMRQTWDNLTTMPPEDALTGPIARGDIETVQKHLAALPTDALPLYRTLGRQTLQLVKERLPQDVFGDLKKLLT